MGSIWNNDQCARGGQVASIPEIMTETCHMCPQTISHSLVTKLYRERQRMCENMMLLPSQHIDLILFIFLTPIDPISRTQVYEFKNQRSHNDFSKLELNN